MSGKRRSPRALNTLVSWLSIALTVLWSAIVPVAAAAQEPPALLVDRVNKAVVAVGEPLVWRIDLFVSVSSTESEDVLRAAFEEATGGFASTGFEIVRIQPVSARASRREHGLLRFSREVVLRSEDPGSVRLPDVDVVLPGGRVTLERRTIHSYRLGEGFHRSSAAIVPLVVERRDPKSGQRFERSATGFFLRDDALVTSYHAVADADRIRYRMIDGRSHSTDRVWSVDPARDVAILHVSAAHARSLGITPLTLSSDALPAQQASGRDALGESVVFTNGWPAGVRRSTAGILYDPASLGADAVWISSNMVRPGDSGGPLLNGEGEVLGVVSSGTAARSLDPTVLRDEVCIASDVRPALAHMRVAVAPESMRDVFRLEGFGERPYVQAFRLLNMVDRSETYPGGLRAALSDFEAMLPSRRGDPGIHFMRGLVYQMLGTTREANASFSKAVDLSETFFPAAYQLGLQSLRSRDMASAEEYFEQTLRWNPYRHIAGYGLARALMARHRYGEAVRWLLEVTRYDPEFAPALFDLSVCYFALGDDAGRALTAFRLETVSRAWSRELARVLDNPLLRPRIVQELPRVAPRIPTR